MLSDDINKLYCFQMIARKRCMKRHWNKWKSTLITKMKITQRPGNSSNMHMNLHCYGIFQIKLFESISFLFVQNLESIDNDTSNRCALV